MYFKKLVPHLLSKNILKNLWNNISLFLCFPIGTFWCFLNVFTAVFHVWYSFLQNVSHIFTTKEKKRQAIGSILLPRIINSRKLFKLYKPKGLLNFWEGWFTHIGYKRTEFSFSYVWHDFVLRTIYRHKIWVKFLLGNKVNDFCLTPFVFWFSSTFSSAFLFHF